MRHSCNDAPHSINYSVDIAKAPSVLHFFASICDSFKKFLFESLCYYSRYYNFSLKFFVHSFGEIHLKMKQGCDYAQDLGSFHFISSFISSSAISCIANVRISKCSVVVFNIKFEFMHLIHNSLSIYSLCLSLAIILHFS